MGRTISIAISAKDNFTQAVTTMRNANNAFGKDLESSRKKLIELDKTRSTLTVSFTKAKQALADAEKAFRLDGSDKNTGILRERRAEYENLRRILKLLDGQARTTEKSLSSMAGEKSRAENRAGGSSLKGSAQVSESLFGRLASAGIGQALGNSLSGAVNTGISSAFGNTAGNAISTALSGTLTGVAMGSIAGPIGAAVGGAVGLLTGGINAAMQVFQKGDDAFKAVVQQQYTGLTERQATDISAGSAISAQREIDKIAFSKLIKGGMDSDAFLSNVRSMANSTPFLYADLTSMSKTLAPAFGDDPEKLLELMQNIGDAGATVGVDVSGMNQVAAALGKLQSTGKTSLEYLDIMQSRGIDAYQFLADGISQEKGIKRTKEQVLEMVTKGLIPGAKAAQMISDGMKNAYSGAMELQSHTFSGLASTMEGWQQERQNAYGEGFNRVRNTGMKEQIGYYEQSGGGTSEVNRLVGQYQASLVNLKEQYQRDAETAVMTGSISELFKSGGDEDQAAIKLRDKAAAFSSLRVEQSNLKRDLDSETLTFEQRQDIERQMESLGNEMGHILMQAQAMAQNEYNVGEGARLELESQHSLIQSIQEDASLKDAYYKTGMVLGEQLSEGIVSALRSRNAFAPNTYFDSEGYAPPKPFGLPTPPMVSPSGKPYLSPMETIQNGFAYGLSYVPRDDYPARLHEGERVLTASEARAYRGGAAPNVTVSGNSFTVREEADVYKIAQALAGELARAQMIS